MIEVFEDFSPEYTSLLTLVEAHHRSKAGICHILVKQVLGDFRVDRSSTGQGLIGDLEILGRGFGQCYRLLEGCAQQASELWVRDVVYQLLSKLSALRVLGLRNKHDGDLVDAWLLKEQVCHHVRVLNAIAENQLLDCLLGVIETEMDRSREDGLVLVKFL